MASGRFQSHKFRAKTGTAGRVKFRTKSSKFRLNNPYWIRKLGAAQANALKMQGAYIRRTARQSLRFRKDLTNASAPHTPPHVHTRDHWRTLRNIQYDLDPHSLTLIIGPIGMRRPVGYGRYTVPSVHEKSGVVRRTVRYVKQIGSGVQRKAPRKADLLANVTKQRRAATRRRLSQKQKEAYRRKVLSGEVRFGKVTYTATYPKRNFMRRAMIHNKRTGKLLEAWYKGFHNSWG